MANVGYGGLVEGLKEGDLKEYINKGYKINQINSNNFTAMPPSNLTQNLGAPKISIPKAPKINYGLANTPATQAPVAQAAIPQNIGQTYNPSNVADLMKGYRTAMATDYAPEYSPESIQKMTNQYAALLAPQYERSAGTLANQLAGRGVFTGSPASNKFQLLEAQRTGDIGQYGLGLMNQAQQARTAGRQTAEQNAYGLLGQSLLSPAQQQQIELQKAGLTGYLDGTPTIAGQENVANIDQQKAEEALARSLGYPNAYAMSLADPKDIQARMSQLKKSTGNPATGQPFKTEKFQGQNPYETGYTSELITPAGMQPVPQITDPFNIMPTQVSRYLNSTNTFGMAPTSVYQPDIYEHTKIANLGGY